MLLKRLGSIGLMWSYMTRTNYYFVNVHLFAGKGKAPRRTGSNCTGNVRAMKYTTYNLEAAISSASLRERASRSPHSTLTESKCINR